MCFCAAGWNQYRDLKWRAVHCWRGSLCARRYNEQGQKSPTRWRSTAEELAGMRDGQREIKDTSTHLSCFSQQACCFGWLRGITLLRLENNTKNQTAFSWTALNNARGRGARRAKGRLAQHGQGWNKKAAAEWACPDHRAETGKLAPQQGLNEDCGLVNGIKGNAKTPSSVASANTSMPQRDKALSAVPLTSSWNSSMSSLCFYELVN